MTLLELLHTLKEFSEQCPETWSCDYDFRFAIAQKRAEEEVATKYG